MVGGLLVVAGTVIGAYFADRNNVRGEQRKNDRLDSAVRTEVLAHLRAEAEQVRLMYVTAIVVNSQLAPIHQRLVDKVFNPQTAQAFGGSAAALLDTVTACDWAFHLQKERTRGRTTDATAEEVAWEIRQVRGLWNRPFEQLQAFFKDIGETSEVAKFEEARQQQASYIAAGVPVPIARSSPW
jgi:hypothetical protein